MRAVIVLALGLTLRGRLLCTTGGDAGEIRRHLRRNGRQPAGQPQGLEWRCRDQRPRRTQNT